MKPGDLIILAGLAALLLIAIRPRADGPVTAGSMLSQDAAQPQPTNPAPSQPATAWMEGQTGTLASSGNLPVANASTL